MKNKISSLSKILLFLGSIALIISLFVPIWSIYLDAPQYPEGLSLQIWAHKIAGDVDIINGLNHYIGMKTLHTEDFIEFKLLPYIISFFALLFIVVALLAKKKWVYILFIAFLLFGIIAMVDFWKWEYDYGHHLDPNAAIKVPGMSYQPPLIGFKQLLNFGAYSIPDIGGWLFISAGLLLLTAVVMEWRASKKRIIKGNVITVAIISCFLFTSCQNNGPQPIRLNKDACDFCKMSISDGRFMAEIVTKKGRAFKFDDIACMITYARSQDKSTIRNFYVGDFEKGSSLVDAGKVWYVKDETLRSPMGGNTAAIITKDAAESFAKKYQTKVQSWDEINNVNQE